jgi:tRNA modification GTPase
MKGATRVQFEQLRTEIIGCLAKIEALIDFGEGEDIEEGVYEEGWYSDLFCKNLT